MPKKETFTSRFEETRGGRVPQKSKIWGDVVYGWSLSKMFSCTFLPILLYNFYVLTKKKNEHFLLHSTDSKSMYRFISSKDAQTCIKITDFKTKKTIA